MGTEDADDHRARRLVVEHGDDEFSVDLGAVGPPDHRGDAPAQQRRNLRVHEVLEAALELAGHGVGHDVEHGAPHQRARRPSHQLLGRRVGVADLALRVGGHHGVAQLVEHGDAEPGPGRVKGERSGIEEAVEGVGRARLLVEQGARFPVHGYGDGDLERRSRQLGQHGREPHRLGRRVAMQVDAPVIGERAHDLQPPTTWRVGRRRLGHGEAFGRVGHRDTDGSSALDQLDRNVELAGCMLHRVGGQLREHECQRLANLLAVLGQDVAEETPGFSDGAGPTGERPTRAQHPDFHCADIAVSGSGLGPVNRRAPHTGCTAFLPRRSAGKRILTPMEQEIGVSYPTGGLHSAPMEERYESELSRSATVLDGVDRALERMSVGNYGTCETCATAILPADLERDPTQRHCEQHLEFAPAE